MESRNDLNEALQFLHQNYPDALVNNNKYVIENEPAEHCEIFKMTSMKQSVFKNIIYRKSLFENVALTGSTFDNVTFVDSKIVGNSFANCNFTSTVIDGSRATLSANNFSQSNFEQSSFVRVKFFQVRNTQRFVSQVRFYKSSISREHVGRDKIYRVFFFGL